MIEIIRKEIKKLCTLSKEKLAIKARFFKSGPGQYAEGDQFIGINNFDLQKIAKKYQEITLENIQEIISSKVNEERLLAIYFLVSKYKKSAAKEREEIFNFYIKNIHQINNWNLVDASAHHIVGAYLLTKNRNLLTELAKNQCLWQRRIAIISTLYFIKSNDFFWTIKLSEKLLNDSHDLIHKAVGWMLREVGKRDKEILLEFLHKHCKVMPRTMLRYAIEKLDEIERKYYMAK